LSITLIYPSSLHFNNYSVVSFPIAILKSPNDLSPLNLGPKTGKLGKASNFTYLKT